MAKAKKARYFIRAAVMEFDEALNKPVRVEERMISGVGTDDKRTVQGLISSLSSYLQNEAAYKERVVWAECIEVEKENLAESSKKQPSVVNLPVVVKPRSLNSRKHGFIVLISFDKMPTFDIDTELIDFNSNQ